MTQLRFRAVVMTTDAHESVRSPYFEKYWLPLLGPTGVVLMRRLAQVCEDGEVYLTDPVELAREIGIKTAVLQRTLVRLVQMELVRCTDVGGPITDYSVRCGLEPLDDEQVGRLPARLRTQHRFIKRAMRAAV